jgi:hypothetical protein
MAPGYITIIFITADRDSDLESKVTAAMEIIAHPFDYGYNQIHAEIVVNNTGYSAVGRPPDHCVIKYNFKHNKLNYPHVQVVNVPVIDTTQAEKDIEFLATTHATYKVAFTDFLIPSMFLKELDFEPAHWGHLFCSEFVLMCLRLMCKHNILLIPLEKEYHLYECNSRTCTPAQLKHILDKIL